MLVGWAILSPISKLNGWAPGPVGSMSDGARGWILWVALAVMCAESVVSLMPVVVEFALGVGKALRGITGDGEDDEDESEDRLVPVSWVIKGIAGSVVVGTTVVWLIFGADGIRPWATVVAFAVGSVLGLLG